MNRHIKRHLPKMALLIIVVFGFSWAGLEQGSEFSLWKLAVAWLVFFVAIDAMTYLNKSENGK